MTDYSTLPEHMRDGARRYIENGVKPGAFLTAVLCNDLWTASLQAGDDVTSFRPLALFLSNEAPADCWGSITKVAAWIARGGLAGKDAA